MKLPTGIVVLCLYPKKKEEITSISTAAQQMLNLFIFLVNCGQSQTFRRRPISTMIYPLSNNFYNHLSKIIFATALHTLSPLED